MVPIKEININFKNDQVIRYSSGLRQWDRGKRLAISGLDVTDNVQVHFSLTDSVGTAKCYAATVDEGKICVDIPQFILEKEGTRGYSYYAYAWVYISTEDMGETIREIVFSIDCRAKPEDYISDPEDEKTWEELEKRIEDFEKNGVSEEQIALAVESYMVKNPPQITVDTELSEKSSNPVANNVVTKSIKEVETTIGNIDVLLGTI